MNQYFVMLKENDANEVKVHTDKLKDERIVVIYYFLP